MNTTRNRALTELDLPSKQVWLFSCMRSCLSATICSRWYPLKSELKKKKWQRHWKMLKKKNKLSWRSFNNITRQLELESACQNWKQAEWGDRVEEKIIKRRRALANCMAVPTWSPFLERTASYFFLMLVVFNLLEEGHWDDTINPKSLRNSSSQWRGNKILNDMKVKHFLFL